MKHILFQKRKFSIIVVTPITMNKLYIFFFWMPVLAFGQSDISIDVHNVPASEGKISVALYDTEATFLKFHKVYASTSTPAEKGITHLLLKNIPHGKYAIALFHDKNGNDILDTNWLGIPKERVAFSNAKMKLFGPPSFHECAFELKVDKTVEISL